jgi:hypothetical protein
MALSRHHEEIENVIAAELKAIDIADLVAHEVRMNIGLLIGAAVRGCVEESIKAVIGSWELHQHVREAVTKAIIESMLESLNKEVQ